MNQKHPLQIRINEERESLLSKFLEFKGTMPSEFEQIVEAHLNKLLVISDDLKDVLLDNRPSWFTEDVQKEVVRLWALEEGDRYTHRVEACKMVMRVAEEAGFKVTLSKFDELRKKYCA